MNFPISGALLLVSLPGSTFEGLSHPAAAALFLFLTAFIPCLYARHRKLI